VDLVNKFLVLQQSLIDLSIQDTNLEQDAHSKIQSILKSCGQLLDISRVSLWCFSEDRKSIICQSLYINTENRFEAGMIIYESSCPNYFKALNTNRIINANNAKTDKRTCEFLGGYLEPLNIISMLDAPIIRDGQLAGILCIEQTNNQHNWDMAEISYAVSVADTISLIYAQSSWLSEKQKMRYMERVDPLTNLENRFFFQKRINQIVSSSIENNNCAVILIGLDDFTNINDRFGYSFANKVLCEIAHRLENITTEVPLTLSRVGGDIFAFWLPEFSHPRLLDNLISEIKLQFNKEIKTPTNEMIQVTSGIGIFSSQIRELGNKDPIRKAELAMLRAKAESPGTICYFKPEWLHKHQEELALEREFIEAINNGQIVAHYQPIVKHNYQSSGLSLEALVRWEHPTKGILTPYVILPIAKRLGLMKELGDIVLEQACHDIKVFIDMGLKLNKISVNISSEQLFSPNLVNQVKRHIEYYQISCSLLEFEIVEELIAGDSEVLTNQLDKLTKLGIDLSIDDFGTGYSSLSRLKHLNVSKLKIDKSFVDGLPNSENDICIIKSIIGLAKGMNLQLVAEGVETKEQARWLFQNGCDYLQGYLISKPIKGSSIMEFLSQKNELPTIKESNYDIQYQGNIIGIEISGPWNSDTVWRMFDDIEKLILLKAPESWALMVDATFLDVGSLGVQETMKSNVIRLDKLNLHATVYIVGNNELLKYQLELLNKEKSGFKRKFFTTKKQAIYWLTENDFYQ